MAIEQNTKIATERASRLLEIYRGEVDDFFKLWPPDKTFFFSSDNKAFIAFGTKNRVAVCMGDPVGRPSSIDALLSEFKTYCKDQRLKIAFVQANSRFMQQYKNIGLKSILIGSDAVIDLDTFTAKTVHNRYFRNIVNRFEKQNYTFSTYSPPHNKSILKEIEVVSNSWIKLPRRKEWSFLTGTFNVDYFQHVTLHVLRDENGAAQAFTNELPVYKPGVATIDLMRHKVDSLNNSIDYLFIRLMQLKQNEGYESFNLGMSPLDGKPFARNMSSRLLIGFYRSSDRFIGFKGLHQFKAKYEPNWEPRYVYYQAGILSLPKIGIAVKKLLVNS